MDKANIIDEIYNFKKVEFSPDEINHKIEILNFQNLEWENSQVVLYYSLNKFFIEVSLEAKTIKIEKDAKENIFKEKHGKYKMALSKFEAKNLASLIFSAHNILQSEL
ncbi:MAG: hypothetical protein MSS71_07110 [Campylobacter sp.]|uniref:hypothetical protein n=1 Tax=Campylobacter sp. TaxID=205 RepID=UPI002AA6441E|nr:hypothetical protein [Campylobacter sp.]MCI7587603.1 hypothetical protein [Campylobacter sp.]